MKIPSDHQQAGLYNNIFNNTRKSHILLLLLFAIALGFYSCSDDSTGAVNGNGNGNGGGVEIGTEPTFSNVSQIFQSTCAPCHISQTTNGVRLNNHDNVLGSVGTQYGVNVVQPGNADGSPLVDKIEGSPQFGVRMPEGGPFLSSDRIEQIKEWIDNGAEND